LCGIVELDVKFHVIRVNWGRIELLEMLLLLLMTKLELILNMMLELLLCRQRQ